MKNFSLRLPDEMYDDLAAKGEEINCSMHSMIMFMIKLGTKVYESSMNTTVRLTEQKPQSRHSSSHKDE